MFRVDIPEGSTPAEQLFAYGRIKSLDSLKEWYFCIRVFSRVFFFASGKYRNGHRSIRHWVI